jgi:hypothetical protein
MTKAFRIKWSFGRLSTLKVAMELLDMRGDYFVVRGTVRAGRITSRLSSARGREGHGLSVAAVRLTMWRSADWSRNCTFPRVGKLCSHRRRVDSALRFEGGRETGAAAS